MNILGLVLGWLLSFHLQNNKGEEDINETSRIWFSGKYRTLFKLTAVRHQDFTTDIKWIENLIIIWKNKINIGLERKSVKSVLQSFLLYRSIIMYYLLYLISFLDILLIVLLLIYEFHLFTNHWRGWWILVYLKCHKNEIK